MDSNKNSERQGPPFSTFNLNKVTPAEAQALKRIRESKKKEADKKAQDNNTANWVFKHGTN